jgi:hypothetical protein
MWIDWLPPMGRGCPPAKLASIRTRLLTGSMSLGDARPHVPMTLPSRRRMTTVADRGRPSGR